MGNPVNLRLYLKHRLFCWAIKCFIFFSRSNCLFRPVWAGSGVFGALLDRGERSHVSHVMFPFVHLNARWCLLNAHARVFGC